MRFKSVVEGVKKEHKVIRRFINSHPKDKIIKINKLYGNNRWEVVYEDHLV